MKLKGQKKKEKKRERMDTHYSDCQMQPISHLVGLKNNFLSREKWERT